MILPKIELAQSIINLCQQHAIKHIVISPGSRNAPLTIGFTNHPDFSCYSIVDERCAAFFAMGIAQQTEQAVALICTSGSALLNYFPAVAEAFYSQIPLIILSADRPDKLVGIGDGQTIDQKMVYGNHVLYHANLSEEANDHNHHEISTAIQTAQRNKGPVHINVPFSEPLYETVEDYSVSPKVSVLKELETQEIPITELTEIWSTTEKKMVLVGVQAPNCISSQVLEFLANDPSVIVFTETTSNVHHPAFFPSIDKIIMPLNDDQLKQLQPELLITIGGMIVSKKVKAFLRNHQPKAHWHIGKNRANDTFFSLNNHFKTDANTFFKSFCDRVAIPRSDFKKLGEEIKISHNKKHIDYVEQIAFCDLKVFDALINQFPDHSDLHLGNSSPIRYMQLFDNNPTVNHYCNRGTSGIDGCTSTSIGAAVVSKRQTTVITGDLGFFYDSNALWNNYIPNDFRIVVINNRGGGIFRILPGEKDTENFDTYFETIHELSAMDLCKMYNFDYVKVVNENQLNSELMTFFDESNKPRLLEIHTPRTTNDEVLLNYFECLKEKP